jgi:hypothetical protein
MPQRVCFQVKKVKCCTVLCCIILYCGGAVLVSSPVEDVHTVRYVRVVRNFRGCVVCCDSQHTYTYLKPKKAEDFCNHYLRKFCHPITVFLSFLGTEVELYCIILCIVLYCALYCSVLLR